MKQKNIFHSNWITVLLLVIGVIFLSLGIWREEYAERQARRGNVMYMADWVKRLDAFLQFNEEDILHDKGKVTAAIAKAFAEKEFEKFRVLQDRTYQSDFDRLVAETSDDLTE